MKKSVQTISLFLGVSMFAFGALKFINPFKLWYTTQVVSSELPFQQFSYWAGQLGEIASGLIFILLVFFGKKNPHTRHRSVFTMTNISVIVMMLVAIYVHLHPNVPHEVLPLKIKLPVIPIFFLIFAIINIWLNEKSHNSSH